MRFRARSGIGRIVGTFGAVVAMSAAMSDLGASCAVALAKSPESPTTTPIKHLVIIFQENVSFDHYFATYPVAANPSGEPQFVAKDDTPTVNGLAGRLLTANPNSVQPFRLDRSQSATCDQDHEYKDEQLAQAREDDRNGTKVSFDLVERPSESCETELADLFWYVEGREGVPFRCMPRSEA